MRAHERTRAQALLRSAEPPRPLAPPLCLSPDTGSGTSWGSSTDTSSLSLSLRSMASWMDCRVGSACMGVGGRGVGGVEWRHEGQREPASQRRAPLTYTQQTMPTKLEWSRSRGGPSPPPPPPPVAVSCPPPTHVLDKDVVEARLLQLCQPLGHLPRVACTRTQRQRMVGGLGGGGWVGWVGVDGWEGSMGVGGEHGAWGGGGGRTHPHRPPAHPPAHLANPPNQPPAQSTHPL